MTNGDVVIRADGLPELPPGTVVAVNRETGESLFADDEEQALTLFEQRFGWGVPASLTIVGETAPPPVPHSIRPS